jgi:hypothetical protein
MDNRFFENEAKLKYLGMTKKSRLIQLLFLDIKYKTFQQKYSFSIFGWSLLSWVQSRELVIISAY